MSRMPKNIDIKQLLNRMVKIGDFIKQENTHLNRYLRKHLIINYPSCYRAFRYGIRFIYLRPIINDKIVDGESEYNYGKIDIKGIIDAESFIKIYDSNFPLFMAFDNVRVPLESWTLIDMHYNKVFFLLMVRSNYDLHRLLSLIQKAYNMVKNKIGWEGKIYYKVCEFGKNRTLF